MKAPSICNITENRTLLALIVCEHADTNQTHLEKHPMQGDNPPLNKFGTQQYQYQN